MERVIRNLRDHHLWKDSYEARLAAVVSELEQPLLGMDADMYRRLCDEVDVVYHNAALVAYRRGARGVACRGGVNLCVYTRRCTGCCPTSA